MKILPLILPFKQVYIWNVKCAEEVYGEDAT